MKSKAPAALGAVLLLLSALVSVGVFAFYQQIVRGDVVTGMRTVGAGGAVWGLYVVMDGFFLGAGVAVMACACLARFSRDRDLEAVARIAMPVAITCFLGGALCVVADQGRPWAALVGLAQFARPQSPMFVTFTWVGAICLFASLVHCVLARRADLAEYAKRPSRWQPLQRLLAFGYRGSPAERHRRSKSGFWMSALMVPALITPLTALAIIFVVRPARPLAATLMEVLAFFLLSLAGGLGLLLVAAAMVGRLAGRSAGLGPRGFARLGKALLFTLSLSLPVIVLAEISAIQSDEPADSAYGWSLLSDTYALLFWTILAGLFLAAGLLWRGARRGRLGPRATVVAGVVVQVAVFLHHYLLLVAWQTHGLALPYKPGVYAPTWIEVAVVLGVVAFCVLALLPAIRLIPFAPLVFEAEPDEGRVGDPRRSLITGIWFLAGLAIAGIGFALSARVGTEPYLDPIVPGSPVVFIAGLMVLATTGAVYELLPDRK